MNEKQRHGKESNQQKREAPQFLPLNLTRVEFLEAS